MVKNIDKYQKPIKICVSIARERGFPVCGGVNGGGWIRLAEALGATGLRKTEARRMVMDVLGLEAKLSILASDLLANMK